MNSDGAGELVRRNRGINSTEQGKNSAWWVASVDLDRTQRIPRPLSARVREGLTPDAKRLPGLAERRSSFRRRHRLERVGEAVATVEGDEVVEREQFEAAHNGEGTTWIGVAGE